MVGLGIGIGLTGGGAGSGGGYTPPTKLLGYMAGQSLGDYVFVRGTPRVAIPYMETLRTLMGYDDSGTMQVFAAGGDVEVCADSSTKAGTDYTVKIVNGASGGSALVGRNANASGENYWWNFEDNSAVTGNPADTAGTPGPLLRDLKDYIDTYGAPNFIEWSQGESDQSYVSGGSTERQNYKDCMELLIAEIRDHVGNASLPFFIRRIGRGNRAGSYQDLKDIQYEISAEGDYVFIGAEQYITNYAIADTFTASITSGVATIPYASASSSNTGINMNMQATELSLFTYVVAPLVDGVSFDVSPVPTGSNASASIDRMDDTHPYPGADGDEPLTEAGNTTHNTNLGFYAISKRMADTLSRYFLGTFGAEKQVGPSVVSIAAPIGGTSVYLNIEHDQGTALTNENGAITSASSVQFRVENNGVAKTISGVLHPSPTTIELVLSSAISSGDMDVWVGYSSMNRTDWRVLITDNATIRHPLLQGSPTTEPAVFAVIPGDAQPINTIAPVFVGDAAGTVTLLDGTWTGSASFTYAYDYEVNDVAVSGSTNSFDITTLTDGDVLTGFVTATNSEGSTRVPCGNPITVSARNATVASVSSSAVFDLDATIGTSANGIEQYWRNMITAPADGSARGGYDFFRGASASASTADPTLTGTVDDPAAYWLMDSGDYWTKAAVNTALLRDSHKTTGGGPRTLAFAMKFVNSGVIQALFGTGSSSTDHGFYLGLGTTNRLNFKQQNGTTEATTTASSGSALADGVDALMVVTFDYTGTAVKFFIRSKTQDSVTTLSKNTDTTDASFDMRIGARGTNSSRLPNGTRVYAAAAFNAILSNAEVGALFDLYEARHARDYTP